VPTLSEAGCTRGSSIYLSFKTIYIERVYPPGTIGLPSKIIVLDPQDNPESISQSARLVSQSARRRENEAGHRLGGGPSGGWHGREGVWLARGGVWTAPGGVTVTLEACAGPGGRSASGWERRQRLLAEKPAAKVAVGAVEGLTGRGCSTTQTALCYTDRGVAARLKA
jgi:hypothetical protein